MPDDRARVLARVRAALSPLPTREPMPAYPDDVALTRGASSGRGSVAAFASQLEAAGGRAFTTARDLAQWLTESRRFHGYCDPALVPAIAEAFGASFTLETRLVRDRIDEYDFGITRAAGAIAETGTIILNDASTSRRLGALAPWVHVAVVHAADIHGAVADALSALGDDPYVVFCTGPSKTADVEGILIQGVHGPGEQVALIL